MKVAIALCLVALASVSVSAVKEKADAIFLKKQQQVLKLLWRLSSPVEDPELVDLIKGWTPLEHLSEYKNPETVKHYFEAIPTDKHQQRGEIFNLFNPSLRKEMIELFEILHFTQTWDMFIKTAVYAREHTNEGQFFYAFSVAVVHRKEGLELPPPYEVFPHLFTTSDVIRQAYRAKMTQTPIVIPMNFTGTIRNPEQRVSYFGEDIGMNAHHSHWHMDFPFWWDDAKYGITKDRQGELFWYAHHQLSVRFDAERLSNNLRNVDALHWDKPIVDGFVPKAIYKSGVEFPTRPDNMKFQDLPGLTVNDMKQYESRIRKSIALGLVMNTKGQKISLNDTDGIDILGSLLESNKHSVHQYYYGSLHNKAHVMLSKVTDPKGKFGLAPGVMEHFETATRDPAFFRLHKYMDNIVKEHKFFLAPYTHEELDFPGVTVEAVKVVGKTKASTPNHLVTYFDDFLFDMSNALDTSKNVKDVDIQTRVRRLSHEPFEYVITANSNKETNAVARIFLIPKLDWFGDKYSLDEFGWNMIEMDKFVIKLKNGQNVIRRSSDLSSVTIKDRKGFREMLKEVNEAIAGTRDYMVDTKVRHCGHPQGLLLPKGKLEGMKFKLVVHLSSFETDILPEEYAEGTVPSLSYCGVLSGKNPDMKPLGYPFDRKIVNWDQFKTDNMKYVEVTIQNVQH